VWVALAHNLERLASEVDESKNILKLVYEKLRLWLNEPYKDKDNLILLL